MNDINDKAIRMIIDRIAIFSNCEISRVDLPRIEELGHLLKQSAQEAERNPHV